MGNGAHYDRTRRGEFNLRKRPRVDENRDPLPGERLELPDSLLGELRSRNADRVADPSKPADLGWPIRTACEVESLSFNRESLGRTTRIETFL